MAAHLDVSGDTSPHMANHIWHYVVLAKSHCPRATPHLSGDTFHLNSASVT